MIFIGTGVLLNFCRVLYKFVTRQLLLTRFHASSLTYYCMRALAHISSTITVYFIYIAMLLQVMENRTNNE